MNGLLIAALMASVHPNRLWHRRGGYAVPACCLPCDAMSELLLVSDYSGCTDQNRPSVNAAGVCSYLSDRMSLSVRHYPLCAVASASVASVRMRREFGDIETASCLMLCATCMHRVHHVQCGAAGVNGLLIAALTASAHADRPCH